MNAHSRKAFYYHSHANALGGVLRQPLDKIVSTPASVALASAGGYSSARSERFHVEGLISFEAAHVRVSGSEHKMAGSWRTVTAATIEGLNILEVLTADRVVAQVSVDHPQDGRPIKVSLLGSRFDNLRVHGSPVKPGLNPKIFGAGRAKTGAAGQETDNSPLSFAELLKLAEEQHKHRNTLKLPKRVQGRLPVEDPNKDLMEKGSALCSLVQEVGADAPVESFSHMLHIPDFGNVFLGELLVSRFSAKLTMLRVEMGCMADGDVSAGCAGSEGRTMP